MINTYKISVDYDDYFANSSFITSRNIEVVGSSIMFYTDEESINYLNKNDVSYMLYEDKKESVKRFFINKSGIIVGLLVIAFLIIMNSFRISKIEFNAEYPINPLILEEIEGQARDVLFFTFHKNNYDKIAKDLRATYCEYEWISIEKKGSVVYINIEPTTTKEVKYDDGLIGNIIASKDGIVEEFVVFNGTSSLSSSMYVKKGDILINGSDLNVGAKGYVLATTYEQVKIVVPKEIKLEEFSGQIEDYYQVELFSMKFDLFKKNEYLNSDFKSKNKFNIPYIFSVKKVEEYEKNDIMYIYDKKRAEAYARSVIENDFSNNKVLDSEKIIRLEMLKINEIDSLYEITFLVKKVESIGVFVK